MDYDSDFYNEETKEEVGNDLESGYLSVESCNGFVLSNANIVTAIKDFLDAPEGSWEFISAENQLINMINSVLDFLGTAVFEDVPSIIATINAGFPADSGDLIYEAVCASEKLNLVVMRELRRAYDSRSGDLFAEIHEYFQNHEDELNRDIVPAPLQARAFRAPVTDYVPTILKTYIEDQISKLRPASPQTTRMAHA